MNLSVLNTWGQETHFIRVEFHRFKWIGMQRGLESVSVAEESIFYRSFHGIFSLLVLDFEIGFEEVIGFGNARSERNSECPRR